MRKGQKLKKTIARTELKLIEKNATSETKYCIPTITLAIFTLMRSDKKRCNLRIFHLHFN